MFSSPWGRPQRPGAPQRVPPIDNCSDEDSNRQRVFLLEQDERLEIPKCKQQSFFNRMFGEAHRKQLSKGNVFSMFFPSVGVNNLKMEDVNRALRVSGLCVTDIGGVKLNDFRTNQA